MISVSFVLISSVTVLLPDRKTKETIDHLAKYVLKEGPPFEVLHFVRIGLIL
jgi:hypothetical protein